MRRAWLNFSWARAELEARGYGELPDPVFHGPVVRMRVAQLADGEAQDVEAQHRAMAADHSPRDVIRNSAPSNASIVKISELDGRHVGTRHDSERTK